MKIEALQAATLPVATGAAQAARWRQALETALWQSRPSAPTATAAPPGGTGGAQPGGETAAVAAAPLPVADPSVTEPLRPTVAARADAEAAAAARVPAGPPAPAEASTPATLPPAAGMATLARPATAMPNTTPARAAAPPPPPAERPTAWPAVAGQACVQGEQVSASLRDARLSEAEAAALRRTLERRLAGSGLTLAELRVNGQLVVDQHTRS